ncbi:ACD11 homolog protein-like isoform X2 [Salvia miltiorrhiza]|uniref:ACD11 homolog protein-like isoform X2 n=2 Tax=Salvia miltiorrhiza TaxID=226208 RepID=UPI0025ACF1A5|nr:ACD11 homolog protein-like isoform X2 [Salvia miltiorrhiza]
MALKFQSLFSRNARSYTHKNERAVASSGTPMCADNSYQKAEFTPLAAVADAFEELSAVLKAKGSDHDLDLKTFCDACSLVSVLFSCLGVAFKFAEMEYVSKVNDLAGASQSYRTLNNVLDYDTQNNSVRTPGSLSRNLRRVRQGLDLIRVLFQNFLSSNDYYLKDAASTAYAKTCAPYHTWAVRTAAYAGMYALPTRDQLLVKLNENDNSAEKEMIRYINASLPVIEYIDNLYVRRRISLDW